MLLPVNKRDAFGAGFQSCNFRLAHWMRIVLTLKTLL